MRWFGEPWPTAEERAGVCENDEERIPVPIGEDCAQCVKPFDEDDRGVALPTVDVDAVRDTYWHLRCILLTTVGPMADTVLARMGA